MSPRPKKNIPSQFNMMMVGLTGVGKTAFIRTFLEALQQYYTTSCSHDELGALQPTTQATTMTVTIDSEGDKIVLRLIDTPGLHTGHAMENELNDLLKYIEHQFDLTLTEESKVKRNPKAVDSQIHACLYFIDPSKPQLDTYDIQALTQLSKRVNVIPVISKADTLTLAQLRRLKPAILKSIYNQESTIPLYGIPEDEEVDDNNEDKENQKKASSLSEFLDQFDYEEEEEETQSLLDYLRRIPFGLISYEEDPLTGKPLGTQDSSIKIGRDYGWGTINCLSDKDCDLYSLVGILLHTHREMLKAETTERYYEQYRTEKLLTQRTYAL
ncbi:Septin-type guanine nucleotide-binding (G) domain-containing protein [Spinellus fusiger]|nr:Septin-type guanine nucleotide-binding (G) domain-containing protein [Spinellus fusiger]